MTLLLKILNSKIHIESKLITSVQHNSQSPQHTPPHFQLNITPPSSANSNPLFSFLFVAANICTHFFQHAFLGIFTKSSNYNARN